MVHYSDARSCAIEELLVSGLTQATTVDFLKSGTGGIITPTHVQANMILR